MGEVGVGSEGFSRAFWCFAEVEGVIAFGLTYSFFFFQSFGFCSDVFFGKHFVFRRGDCMRVILVVFLMHF